MRVGGGVSHVLTHEVVAGHGDEVTLSDVTELVEDLPHSSRHRRFACAGVAREAHVQGWWLGMQPDAPAQAIDDQQRCDLSDPGLDLAQVATPPPEPFNPFPYAPIP